MEKTPKRRFTADFETATWIENETYVWHWGVSEIGNPSNTSWGIDIDDFMTWCKENSNSIVYMHNLKFDGEFILYYLLKHDYICINKEGKKAAKTFKTIISDLGQFFCITIYFTTKKYIKIIDSLKIIPLPIKKIPGAFGLSERKLELEYERERPKGYIPNQQEVDYLINDVVIPSKAINIMLDQGLSHMTCAGNAMGDYKQMLGKRGFDHFYPKLKPEVDENIRKGYRGGFTYLNPIYAGLVVNNGYVLDVNSLYPSVMYNERLPIGEPKFFEGEYVQDDIYDLYIQQVTCMFDLKPGKIPTVQIKNDKRFRGNEYLTSSNYDEVSLTLTNIDLKLFKENYEIYNIKYIGGWKFRSVRGLFCRYIDKWSGVKIEAKQTGNSGMYTISKLMLNSLYGRFGLSVKTRSKTPYLENEIVKYKTEPEEIRDGCYIPMATFITAYARDKTIRTSQKIKDYSIAHYGQDMYIYSDTDSIHTLLPKEELLKICDIDDYRLGAWKIENEFCRGKFIRQKTYVEEIPGKGLKITCAGLPADCYNQVTFDNFNENLKITGKLVYKHVVGGVKLVETTFKIGQNTFALFGGK